MARAERGENVPPSRRGGRGGWSGRPLGGRALKTRGPPGEPRRGNRRTNAAHVSPCDLLGIFIARPLTGRRPSRSVRPPTSAAPCRCVDRWAWHFVSVWRPRRGPPLAAPPSCIFDIEKKNVESNTLPPPLYAYPLWAFDCALFQQHLQETCLEAESIGIILRGSYL